MNKKVQEVYDKRNTLKYTEAMSQLLKIAQDYSVEDNLTLAKIVIEYVWNNMCDYDGEQKSIEVQIR